MCLELDVDQLPAGADALQLQIPVATDDMAQVAPQSGLTLHRRHQDGLVADDDRRSTAGNDDRSRDISTEAEAVRLL